MGIVSIFDMTHNHFVECTFAIQKLPSSVMSISSKLPTLIESHSCHFVSNF